MKRLYLMLLTAVLLQAACTDLTAPDELPPAEEPVDSSRLIPIRLALPDYYTYTVATTSTRAGTDQKLTDSLARKETQTFPDSTTLWILIEEKRNGTWVSTSSLNMAYTILTVVDDQGQKSSDLVPCTVDSAGNVINTQSSLLYLKPNNYRIRALSPALKLTNNISAKGDTTFNVVRVSNGMTLLANYDDCSYTAPLVLDKETDFNSDSTTAVKTVPLKPLVHQTALLHFSVRPDSTSLKNIYSIQAMDVGCEISGLQAEGDFNWTASEPSWILYLNQKTTALKIYADQFVQENDTCITCEAEILPSSMESTTINIGFNLRINGVPTQYTTSISNRKFLLGFKYAYDIRITQSGNINIAPWINSAASVTVDHTTGEIVE